MVRWIQEYIKMSTWNKAAKVNQKTHRERGQLRNRSHLGLLEKKKDYKERAKDANTKKKVIKILKKKALNKNPDEFNFHMVNSKMVNDEHKEIRKGKVHTPQQLQLMKTRDLKYVILMRTKEKKRIEKLQAQLHLIDKAGSIQNSHTFFVDTAEEAEHFDIAKHLDTHPALLDRKYNRPRMSDLETMNIPELDKETIKSMKYEQTKLYSELQKRIEREKELAITQHKLEMQRALQEKCDTPPKKVQGATPHSAPLYKWKSIRKR